MLNSEKVEGSYFTRAIRELLLDLGKVNGNPAFIPKRLNYKTLFS